MIIMYDDSIINTGYWCFIHDGWWWIMMMMLYDDGWWYIMYSYEWLWWMMIEENRWWMVHYREWTRMDDDLKCWWCMMIYGWRVMQDGWWLIMNYGCQWMYTCSRVWTNCTMEDCMCVCECGMWVWILVCVCVCVS